MPEVRFTMVSGRDMSIVTFQNSYLGGRLLRLPQQRHVLLFFGEVRHILHRGRTRLISAVATPNHPHQRRAGVSAVF